MSIKRQAGLTLVELVLFIVIVGVGLAGILSTMNITTRASADPLRRKQAMLIAEGLLEEVELARFTYCDATDANAESAASTAACATLVENVGREAGETRPFDNVNDYVTAYDVEQGAFNANGVLVDAAGVAIQPLGYAATLKVSATNTIGPAGSTIVSTTAPATTEILKLTVKVTYGTGASDFVTIDGYRFRFAPNSTP